MSIENPNVPLSQFDEDDATTIGLVTSRSSSGIPVNREKALGCSAVWRAVTLISTDVAKIPLIVYRRRRSGGKAGDRNHPAYPLLQRKPNPRLNAFTFKQTLTANVLLHGNGLAWIERRGDGVPIGLIWLDPTRMSIGDEGGQLWYIYEVPGTAEFLKLFPEDVLHLKGLGYDGRFGYSVLNFAKHTLGLSVGARDYQASFFRSNAMPGVLLTHPATLSKDAQKRLKDAWNSMHQGVNNAHKTAILEEGMDVKALSMTAQDAELMETRAFGVREIANFFGVPAHKLGDTTRTSFSSLEQENLSYLEEALDGRLVMWESECNDKLLTEDQKRLDSHFCEFERESVVKIDTATMVSTLTAEVNNGLLSLDEARLLRNRPPLPNGLGKSYRIPLNLGILGEEDEEIEPTPAALPPPPEPDEGENAGRMVAHRRLIVDAARRSAKRLGTSAKRAARNPQGWLNWLDRIEIEHGRSVVRLVEPAVAAYCAMRGSDADQGKIARQAANAFFDAVREGGLEACECQPSELVASVQEWAHTMESELPCMIADGIAIDEAKERSRERA